MLYRNKYRANWACACLTLSLLYPSKVLRGITGLGKSANWAVCQAFTRSCEPNKIKTGKIYVYVIFRVGFTE